MNVVKGWFLASLHQLTKFHEVMIGWKNNKIAAFYCVDCNKEWDIRMTMDGKGN